VVADLLLRVSDTTNRPLESHFAVEDFQTGSGVNLHLQMVPVHGDRLQATLPLGRVVSGLSVVGTH
jgi:hypothetical protein